MIARFWHPSRREADISRFDDGILLKLWSDELPFFVVDATEACKDTPANRRHLRTLAVDWCAHGVSWCDAKTRGGLPKRGVMRTVDLEIAIWIASAGSPDFHPLNNLYLRLEDERAAVRETSR
jgi:hypothetical protein